MIQIWATLRYMDMLIEENAISWLIFTYYYLVREKTCSCISNEPKYINSQQDWQERIWKVWCKLISEGEKPPVRISIRVAGYKETWLTACQGTCNFQSWPHWTTFQTVLEVISTWKLKSNSGELLVCLHFLTQNGINGIICSTLRM